MITITKKPEIEQGKSGCGVTLSDSRTAYLGSREYSTLNIDDDESKFDLVEKPRKNGEGTTLFINPKGGAKPFGGGGGGYKAPPKDEASIVCQTIIKEASESARAEALQKNSQFDMARAESIAAGLVGIYVASYSKVKGVHGS